jgi:phosphoadenylyl-sulfate reductase (thioredoxin)
MVLLDMAARLAARIRVVTIDTGRLPEATYRIIEIVRERYGIEVEIASPDAREVSEMIRQHGPNLFYRDVSLRRLCCEVRKIRPLNRKLREFDAYAVGLRRGQSESRAETPKMELVDGKWKLSPLTDWTPAQVDHYIREHNVPLHPLYAEGYTSIGCQPCTRPADLEAGDRSGRWWWEHSTPKECGLHLPPTGAALRKLDVLLQELSAGS